MTTTLERLGRDKFCRRLVDHAIARQDSALAELLAFGREHLTNAACTYLDRGLSTIKTGGLSSAPVDPDNRSGLFRLENPNALPVLHADEATLGSIDFFSRAFQARERLLCNGCEPPSRIALVGPSGTGKTTTARYVAAKPALPLLIINMANLINSHVGVTGRNIASVFEYARKTPCVLLLDEADAVAAARSSAGEDNAAAGEQRRVVSVLLKELEYWPVGSVLAAASNLPGVLDSALRRRFDLWITTKLPDEAARMRYLKTCLVGKDELCLMVAQATDKASYADLEKLCRLARVKSIVDDMPLREAVMLMVEGFASEMALFS